MTPFFRSFGGAIISLIAAIAMIATAYFGKGTAYENTWLYIIGVLPIVLTAWEMYVKKKRKDQ